MTYAPHGKHLVAGAWIGADDSFRSDPATGPATAFSIGTVAIVDAAAQAAEDAFWVYSATTAQDRAAFLNAIADEIDARADAITDIGSRETGLPPARLIAERGRTTGQLRLFGRYVTDPANLDGRHDPALPDRQPLPRPDLRLMQRPVGPVAVFGASNFPLAFSTAGGDTAAALAAGCPVVVKGHEGHPGTAEIVAEAIHAAIRSCGMPAGVFSLVQGGDRAVGQALVQHPLIRAVGFTGSLAAGRALFDLCAQRPDPIPFFGELGSVNPMFLLPHALSARSTGLAQGWSASLTQGAGQFCTNPGIAVVIDGPGAQTFAETARAALAEIGAQMMLTPAIAAAYATGADHMTRQPGVTPLLAPAPAGRSAIPGLFTTSAADWAANPILAEEVFGPLGLIVVARDAAEMLRVAHQLRGQLTATLHMDNDDHPFARHLLPVLERKAGRILANGFPTGVEVCDSMVHGGPYPASTNFGATSVGTMSIRRFQRPVCYQDLPQDLV